MLDLIHTNLNIGTCPKCGKFCLAWRHFKRHFFPKPKKRISACFEEGGIIKRRCTKCSLVKSLDCFSRRKDRPNQVRPVCKDCRTKDAKRYFVDRKGWYARKMNKTHRPCASCSAQREKGQPKYCLNCREESLRRSWKAQHLTAKNRRKSRLKGNGGSFTAREWISMCERFGNRCIGPDCNVVGLENLTVDHIIPISKGGRNEISNIQPLCHACNVKKSDQTIDYRLQGDK